MVGDQHRDAQTPGRLDPGMAGDAIVHGDDQVRTLLGGQGHDLRGQAVAVIEPVGHQMQAREGLVQLLGRANLAGTVDTAQDRVHIRRPGGGGRGCVALDDFSHRVIIGRREPC